MAIEGWTRPEKSPTGEPVKRDVDKAIEGLSLTRLAVRRLRRDKLTMMSLVVVVSFFVLAAAAPLLSATKILDPFAFNNDLIDQATGGLPKGGGGGFSWGHPLGVEPGTGRDVLARLVLGVTFSLMVAISATVVAVMIGTVLGIISGYVGGTVDMLISRLVDMTLAFPQTLMLIALSGLFIEALVSAGVPSGNPSNGVYIILVLGLFGWPSFARLIRGQVLSQREREYIEAARSLGARNGRIYFKELLPNLWAPVLVYFTLTLPAFISAEAALSFLSVGIKPPTPTLGNVLANSTNYSSSDFTYFFFPALIIATLVVSFNLLGDGLRDALDPKANR
ncbi:MAG: ABC transporter permease [Kineosporiaceae bacterium]